MYVRLGDGETSVLAPVGPGLISRVGIQEYRLMSLEDEAALQPAACTIAVDGERQLEVFAHQKISVRLAQNGPQVVDVRRCLHEASRLGIFRTTAKNV